MKRKVNRVLIVIFSSIQLISLFGCLLAVGVFLLPYEWELWDLIFDIAHSDTFEWLYDIYSQLMLPFGCNFISLASVYFGIVGIRTEKKSESHNKKRLILYRIFTIGSAVTLVINSVAMWELLGHYIASV